MSPEEYEEEVRRQKLMQLNTPPNVELPQQQMMLSDIIPTRDPTLMNKLMNLIKRKDDVNYQAPTATIGLRG